MATARERKLKYKKKLWYSVYRALDELTIVRLKRMRKNSGLWWSDGIVELDPRDPILVVGIHECLHQAYPDWEEDEVNVATHFLVESVTIRQAKEFLKRLAMRL